MARTTVASPTPLGAGRIRDLTFQDPNTAGAGATTGQLRVRGDGVAALNGTVVSLGGTTTAWTYFTAGTGGSGADCMSVNNGGAAGAGVCVHWLNVCNINIRTSRPVFWPLDDDWNVHRVVWIAAAGLPSTNNDTGVQLLNSNVSGAGIQRTPVPGFGMQFTTTGFALRTNNGGGVIDTPLATQGVGGYDILQLHSYDMRIGQALPNQDAFLKILLDGVLVHSSTWANNPNLPVPSAGNVGFFPALWCNSAAQGIVTKYLGFQAAPTEAFLL